jgi:hypothetical protein
MQTGVVLRTHRMDTLQRHMPLSGQDGMAGLLKIAARFEEKIYFAATDQVWLHKTPSPHVAHFSLCFIND